MKVEYHPSTITDLNRAVDFYEQQRIGLGDELRDEIYQTIARIAAIPLIYRPITGQIRRCLFIVSLSPSCTGLWTMTCCEYWSFVIIVNIRSLE